MGIECLLVLRLAANMALEMPIRGGSFGSSMATERLMEPVEMTKSCTIPTLSTLPVFHFLRLPWLLLRRVCAVREFTVAAALQTACAVANMKAVRFCLP